MRLIRRTLVVATVLGLLLVGYLAWSFLVPPESGSGWRLESVRRGDAAGWAEGAPIAELAGHSSGEVLLRVLAFWSSSCPPELRGVDFREHAVVVRASQGLHAGCTDDAAPHAFVIALDGSRLPDAPFEVRVEGDTVGTNSVTIERIP